MRAPDIEIDEAEGGYVVYQPGRERVHYLNHTAAVVLELCTGEHEAAAIGRLLATAYDLPDPPVEAVEHCLAHLRSEGLVA